MIFACFFAGNILAQDNPCDYSASELSIELANEFRRANNYPCAKEVLSQVVIQDTVPDCTKAEAFAMMGMINYRIFKGQNEETDSTLKYFLKALEICPGYTGSINKDTTRLGRLYTSAADSLSKIAAWQERKSLDSLINICGSYKIKKRNNNRWKLVTAVVGIGASAGALLFNGKANDSYDEYKGAISPADIESAWDDYEKNRNWRNYMIGLASVAAVAEVIWFIKAPKKPDVDCDKLANNAWYNEIDLAFHGSTVQLTFWF
jgi:hypothetical protein